LYRIIWVGKLAIYYKL